jgi:hypothetical protein
MKFYKVLISLILILVSKLSYGVDPSVSVYTDHGVYTSAHSYEFDILIKATGATTTLQLRTFQAGLYLNPAWVNGGTVTAQNGSNYSQLSGAGYNGAFQWNGTDNLMNCSVNFDVIGPVSCISSTVTTTPLLITRVRLSNSVDFTCLQPDIKFNYVSNISPLRLRTTFSWREVACTTNYEMFYPGRTYTGTAVFNGETYAVNDVDGRSPANGAGSVNTGFCLSQLAITAFIDGYYLGGGHMQPILKNTGVLHSETDQTDTITVELRNAVNGTLVIPPIKTILSTTGNAYCILDNSLIGTTCWIVVKNRNAIETWSANPITLTSKTTFNFAQ